MIGEQGPNAHSWKREATDPRVNIYDNDAVPFAIKNDARLWDGITVATKRTQEDGVDTLYQLVGHENMGVVGLLRFDHDLQNGTWSTLTKSIENPHADPNIRMDLGFTQSVNGMRRGLTYILERGEEMFMLADIPDKPDILREARGIYNTYGIITAFQSHLQFPSRGLTILQMLPGQKDAFTVGLCNTVGKRLVEVTVCNNEEVDLGEETRFQVHKSNGGRMTVGISYRNDKGEYKGQVLSYPPSVAIGEYAEHVRTRYCKGEDNTVIEALPEYFYDDTAEPGNSDKKGE